MRKRTLSIAAWSLVMALCAPAAAQVRAQDGVPIVIETVSAQRDGVWSPRDSHSVNVRNLSGRPVVAWGAQVYRRDSRARLHTLNVVVIRPHLARRAAAAWPDAFAAPGPPPEYEVRALFALYEDGTWAGNGAMAQREIASLREEHAAARALGQVLAAVPETPGRDDLLRANKEVARAHARASSSRTRAVYESVLRPLAVALDPRLRAEQTPGHMVGVARDAVNRRLDSFERLTFVTAATSRR